VVICVVTGLKSEGGVDHEVTFSDGELLIGEEEPKIANASIRIRDSQVFVVSESHSSVKNTSNIIEVNSYCLKDDDIEKCKDLNKEYIQKQLKMLQSSCMTDTGTYFEDNRKPMKFNEKNNCDLCSV